MAGDALTQLIVEKVSTLTTDLIARVASQVTGREELSCARAACSITLAAKSRFCLSPTH